MLLMKNYFNEIKEKLNKQIELEDLEIVDNSHKHKTHRFFRPEKFHLHLKIKSLQLKSMPRVKAHQLVMSTLNEDLKTRIHALEISIEQ
jgi:BolA family transcriptional regulator, general stress-responsive regulator